MTVVQVQVGQGTSSTVTPTQMQRLVSVGLVEGERRSRRTWVPRDPRLALEAITSVLRPG